MAPDPVVEVSPPPEEGAEASPETPSKNEGEDEVNALSPMGLGEEV